MSEPFNVRLATPADADIIGGHRARMFRDMGDVPPHLFDKFCAMSRERLREQLTSGEYIGWLASPADSSDKIIAGAGAQTWMETYSLGTGSQGVDAAFEALIETRAASLAGFIDGSRHVEAFSADDSA